ncbi:hypothetical protein [Nostoc sp.]|uniref:hypothetical protein n=1 Tax=Nostoc sp. TaxID=1180 RepID=UPI002FF7F900
MPHAKFNVIAVTSYADGTGYRIELAADPSDQTSINAFWGGTPTGRIELTIADKPTALQFAIGDDCDVSFQLTPPTPPDLTPS